MTSFTDRWNALGAELGAALVERWSTFTPSWSAAGATHPRHPLHDVVAPLATTRRARPRASVVTLTTVDKNGKNDSNRDLLPRRAA